MSNGIFLKPDSKASYTNNNGVINLNLTESLALNMNGGKRGGFMNDNLIHLEFSEDTPLALNGGGKEDSTEFFDRIANKITSKLTGGFIGNVNVKDTDDFLTSETINNINLVGGNKSETFNFSSFKKHLARASAQKDDDFEENEEDDDEEDDDELFKDSDDEEDEEDDDDIVAAMEKSADRENSKHSFPVAKRSKRFNSIGKLRDPSDSSESLTLSDDDTADYELSASAESPKLMAYRKVGQGRRFL